MTNWLTSTDIALLLKCRRESVSRNLASLEAQGDKRVRRVGRVRYVAETDFESIAPLLKKKAGRPFKQENET
jgi:hypothetical protein